MSSTISLGNDGWRGVSGIQFTRENVLRIAHAFARYLQSERLTADAVAVGYDGRKDSNVYAEAFAGVLSGYGISVILSDSVVPTPVLSFSVRHLQCSSGVMITASHNPAKYNGIKFKAKYGGPFLSEETRKIESFIKDSDSPKAEAAAIIRRNFLPDYLTHIHSIIDVEALRSFAAQPANNPSVMIDSMGGAGGTIIEDILVPLGWRAQTIFGTPEPNFYDRNPEPIEKNLQPLFYNVGVTDAMIGIATDGDADRCAICFSDGSWVSVQQTVLLLLWHLHQIKKMKGAVIKSVPVTDKVRVLADRWNLPYYEVNVSFQNLTDIMLKTEYLMGVEESAGFGIQGHLPERDGILAGLLFCELLAKSGKTLEELWNDICNVVGELYYKRVDIPSESLNREDILARCEHFKPSKNLQEFFIEKVRKLYGKGVLNGVKYLFGDSRWLLIRASQTEPMVRIYAEGRSEDELNRLLKEGMMLVRPGQADDSV